MKSYKTFAAFIISLAFFQINTVAQNIIYVSVEEGSDQNNGTIDAPFKTIAKAAELLTSGDTCYISTGVYRENVIINNKKGANPIVISSMPGHNVQLNGTELISSQWTKHDQNIYKTTLTNDIWQLFVDNEMMTSARWPNANAWTDEMWDRENNWGHQDASSTYGTMVDDGTLNLAGQTEDFTGAIAILNVGSWLSFAEKITSHGGNSSTFTYTTNFREGQFHHKVNHGYYFIEASLACLDVPNEWYYNPTTKELYLHTADGQSPQDKNIQGKNNTYGIEVLNSENIEINNIDFWACTFKIKDSKNCLVQNCNVNFPSYSKRMLGNLEKAEPTIVDAAGLTEDSKNVIRNCTFQYTDGTGIEIRGSKDVVENCLFYQIDYSCVGSLHDVMVNARKADYLTFRYNTMKVGGNSVGLKMGLQNTVEYNLVSRQGMLQNDGAALQADASESNGAVMTHNWVHNTIKFGLRFDSPWNNPDVYGTYGVMNYNVVWNSKPMIPKGDYHTVYNNTCFDNEGFDLSIFSDEAHGGVNHNTIARNNAVGIISGSNSNTVTPYNGTVENCWIGAERSPVQTLKEQLNDIQNLDFRPKQESVLIDSGYMQQGITDNYFGSAPDIGAYEFGDTLYWIPGRKDDVASNPIPVNLGTSNSANIDLMWRQAYDAISHKVYFGISKANVENASDVSAEFLGAVYNNIVSPGELRPGVKYYWRVDAVKKSGIVKGEVWSFTAGVEANLNDTVKTTVYLCKGDAYTFPNGGVYNNIITDTVQMSELKSVVSNRDSIIITNVFLHDTKYASENVNICSGEDYTYPDGVTQSNILSDTVHLSTLTSKITGCDSIVTTNVQVLKIQHSTEELSLCAGESYTYPDGVTDTNIVSNVTHLSKLVSKVTGCDSLVTTNITMGDVITVTVNENVCSGASYTFPDGSTLSNIVENVTNESLINVINGCDSLIITNINVNETLTVIQEVTLCSGDNYTFPDGTIQNNIVSDTSYTSILKSQVSGCDSIVTTSISISEIIIVEEEKGICSGESYTFPDGQTLKNIMNDTLYESLLQTQNGCDSLITTRLTINDNYNIVNNVTLCAGESYRYPDAVTDTNILSDRVYVSNLVSVLSGCDSVITTNITVLIPDTLSQTISLCYGENYLYPDETLDTNIMQSKTHVSKLVSMLTGCDSLVVTNIEILDVFNITASAEVCIGGGYILPDGSILENIEEDAQYENTLKSLVTGCDSTVVTNLVVIDQVTEHVEVNLCSGDDYAFPDGTIETNIKFNTSQESLIESNGNGCDTLIITEIKVKTLNTNVTSENNTITAINTNADLYTWINCANNEVLESGLNNSFTASASGEYALVISEGNCTDTSSCQSLILSSIHNDKGIALKIWPNPAQNNIIINIPQGEKGIITIYDAKGSIKMKKSVIANELVTLNIQGLSQGLYTVVFNDKKAKLVIN